MFRCICAIYRLGDEKLSPINHREAYIFNRLALPRRNARRYVPLNLNPAALLSLIPSLYGIRKKRRKRGINPRHDPRAKERKRQKEREEINPETIIQRRAESGEANVNRKVNRCATDTNTGLAGRRCPAQSRDHEIAIFRVSQYICAREHAHAWPPSIVERRTANAILRKLNARRTHVVQSRTGCMNKQRNGAYGRVTRTVYPTRIDFPLSSLQIWDTYVATAATATAIPTGMQIRVSSRELLPAESCNRNSKKCRDRCFATRRLHLSYDCTRCYWKI